MLDIKKENAYNCNSNLDAGIAQLARAADL